MTTLTIFWRGSLASCNYGCAYCPFAKTQDDRASLARDRAALDRFADWVADRLAPTSVLITPWGEALIRGYYRDTMVRLSHLTHLETIAVQTNLSCSVDWVAACNLERAAFWTPYHPGETDRLAFLHKIARLEEMGARYSVGVVGLREHIPEIEALRQDLPEAAYLWVNAYRMPPHRYTAGDVARLTATDPLFPLNTRTYPSRGRDCWAGETVVSVMADGTATRCNFIETPIGNIYEKDFEDALKPRPCTTQGCRCHIGYAQLKDLDLRGLFGDGFLERRAPNDVSAATARSRISGFLRAGQRPSVTPPRG